VKNQVGEVVSLVSPSLSYYWMQDNVRIVSVGGLRAWVLVLELTIETDGFVQSVTSDVASTCTIRRRTLTSWNQVSKLGSRRSQEYGD
jgi:hypothetical protein